MREIFETHSESETEQRAYNLALNINPGDIVALDGELGAGKTAFTRGLARFFAPDSRVSSPTFSLVNQYKNIYHFDMYRITGEEDLLSIGFYDYLEKNNIIIIEWFEKIKDFFDERTVGINIIKIKNENDINSRRIIFERVK